MRVLEFMVNKQMLTKNPVCDFSNIVPGSEGYLKARFFFSEDWEDCTKVVGFYYGNTEFPPKELAEDNTCIIPYEALKKPSFDIRVFGQRKGFGISTNRMTISQNGGKT